MKKSKFFKLICSLCLLLCAPFVLCACNESPGDPPEATGGPPSSGESSDVEIGEEGEMSSGQVANFSDYFYGYTVLTNGNGTSFMVDTGNGEISFNNLLDRQFAVFAQDVLRRLSFVYGQGTRVSGTTYELMLPDSNSGTLTSNAYSKDSNTAVVSYSSAVATLSTEVNSSSMLREINVASAEDFQKSILIIPASEAEKNKNYLNYSAGALNLEGAIEGQNMKVETTDDGLGNVTSTLTQNTSKMWNWTGSPSTYNVLATDAHIQSFKMALAQIVAGEETINGTYSSETYNKLLSKIGSLGFRASYKEKIAEFIYNVVINETLVANDVTFGEYFTNNYSGMINSTSINAIKADATFNENTNPRLYKGYKTVVPAIINQAYANVFSTTTQSIYPYFMRVNASPVDQFSTVEVESTDQNGDKTTIEEPTTTGAIDLNTIILMPKSGSLPVVLNLQIEVARQKDVNADIPAKTSINDTNYFAHDIVVDLEINLAYKRGDTVINISQLVPDQEESSVISVDSAGYVAMVPDPNDPQNSQIPAGNGEKMPFTYFLSLYEYFDDLEMEMPAFQDYNGFNPDTDKNLLWNNYFKYDAESDLLYLDAGSDYLQISFNIVSVKQRKGDNNSELVDYTGEGVMFDISLMPYTA